MTLKGLRLTPYPNKKEDNLLVTNGYELLAGILQLLAYMKGKFGNRQNIAYAKAKGHGDWS